MGAKGRKTWTGCPTDTGRRQGRMWAAHLEQPRNTRCRSVPLLPLHHRQGHLRELCPNWRVRQPSAAEGSCSGGTELTPEPLQKVAVACGPSQEAGPAALPRRGCPSRAAQTWLLAAGTMMAVPGKTRWCTLHFRTPKFFLEVSLKEMILHSRIKART